MGFRSNFFLAVILAVGCGSDPPPGPVWLFPDQPLIAGYFGGTPTGQVTLRASDMKTATWTSADPTIATISGGLDDTGTGGLGTATAVAVGMTTLTATSNGQSFSVPLTVESFTAAQVSTGQSTYMTTGCVAESCHDATGPDLTPSGLGKHTDLQIEAAITTAANPEGGMLFTGSASHSFSIQNDALVGLVAYLRSLPPGTPYPDR
jgi:hypothetical protein